MSSVQPLAPGVARWVCHECGKHGPATLPGHAMTAARWHDFIHDPAWGRL